MQRSSHGARLGYRPPHMAASPKPDSPSISRPNYHVPGGCDRHLSDLRLAGVGPPTLAAIAAMLRWGQCTRSRSGRSVSVGPHEEFLADARESQSDPAWVADYRATRPKSSARSPTSCGGSTAAGGQEFAAGKSCCRLRPTRWFDKSGAARHTRGRVDTRGLGRTKKPKTDQGLFTPPHSQSTGPS